MRSSGAATVFGSRHSRASRVPPVLAYAFAVAISLAMVGLRFGLPSVFGTGNWFIQAHPAVLLAAWIGGLGPGLVATGVSAVAAAFLVVPPPSSFALGTTDLRLVLTFAAIGVLMSALVSALVRAREAALGASHTAEAAEQRYRQLVDMTPVAVCVAADGVLAYANAAMARMMGVESENALLGRSPYDFIDPASAPALREQLYQLVSRSAQQVPWQEQTWCKPDGTLLVVESTATLVPWDEGDGVQMILRDVTDERRAREERERLLHAAEEANRAKDAFLATLSHELRTPLNAVLGWAYIMKSSTLDQAGYSRAAEAIHRNCELQARLVDDMLDFSRIVTGKLTLRFETVNLSALVCEVATSFAPTIRLKRQRLDVTVAEACMVTGDPDRLRQVTWNLLSNAAKFSPADTSITLRVCREGETVVLSVEDAGIGITADFLPHIFEAFRQWDSSTTRAHGGLGLGLALVQRLVEAHGGTVVARSAGRELGTTIEVRIPADGRYEQQNAV